MTDSAPAGRVAVVTGAGSGIGRAVALALAGGGHAVVVNDMRHDPALEVVEEIEAVEGGRATAHVGDVADETSVRDLCEHAQRWAGRIDVLVNNAGLADSVVPTVEQRSEDWQRVVDVCLRGPYLCSKHVAARFMLPQESGRIVNVSSIAGVVGLPMRNAYSASKAGLSMMTRTMGAEWAGRGITVNAVAPGYIRTAMVDGLVRAGRLDETSLRRRIPAGRLGAPADIAAAVRFLVSDGARYVTGTTLPVDGGWTAYGAAGDAYPV